VEAGADVPGLREHLSDGVHVGLVVVTHDRGRGGAGAVARPAEEGDGRFRVAVLTEENVQHHLLQLIRAA
jgi:hypothetical protein